MKVVEGKFLLVENLDVEEYSADLKSGAPLVQADPTILVNVVADNRAEELSDPHDIRTEPI